MTNLSICYVATDEHRKSTKYDVQVASCCIIFIAGCKEKLSN